MVAGNAHARRFYARNGWLDAGEFDYAAQVEGGTFVVPCHRYEKRLRLGGIRRRSIVCLVLDTFV